MSDIIAQFVTANNGKKEKARPPFLFKRAQSSLVVPTRSSRHEIEQTQAKKIGYKKRCQSLSPSQIQKKYERMEFEQRDSSLESNYVHPEPDKDTGSLQRTQTKIFRAFATKKREFIKIRKNLMMQQDLFLEQYAALKELEKRTGVEDDALGEIRIVSLKGWPAHDLLILIRDDLEMPTNPEIGGVFGPQVVEQMQAKLYTIPDEVMALGTDLLSRRLDLLNLMRSKHRNDRATYQSNMEWKNKNAEFDAESELLRKMVAGLTENLKAKITASFELAKLSWKDRDIMAKKIERLQKEITKLEYKVDEVSKKGVESEVSQDSKQIPDSTVRDQGLLEELRKERTAKESLKEVVAAAEGMLRVAKSKINTLERQLKEMKSEVEIWRRKHKELEQLYRHRENSYDAHAKKLIENSKTGEITIDTLSRQRDALELRVKELREQAEEAERSAATRETEQRTRAEWLMAKVAEQERNQKENDERMMQLESHIKHLEEQIAILRERSTRLADLERQHCLDYIPSKENQPTNKETEIWKELQATRLALSRAEEELRQSRADKDSFLNSLSKIAQDEGADKENIGAELLSREKKILHLQQIIEDHQENEKIMEQSMTEYENKLAALRLDVMKLRNYNCYAKEIPQHELQTELLVMKTQVETLTRERRALANAAASRALMLERHERSADLFVRMTRARRELEAHLEGRDEPPLGDSSDHVEISRSLSSICASAADAWSALRAERVRVLHLESAVLNQSLQLEKEERVRTQLERRKAVLERELLRTKHTSSSHIGGVGAQSFI